MAITAMIAAAFASINPTGAETLADKETESMIDIGRPSGGGLYRAGARTSSGQASRLHASAVAVVVSALLASIPAARAVPIGVRAKTRVELEHRRNPTGLLLVGRLLDDVGEPIATERVQLELPGLAPVTRLTDDAGRFEIPLSAREVRRLQSDGELVTWTVRFDGNARLGDTAQSGALDLSKRATRMSVTLPGGGPEIVLGDRPIEIRVALADVSEGDERPVAQAAVTLEVGSGSELVGATGTSGAATFVVRPDSLVGGRYQVVARFAGDTLHAAAFAQTRLTALLPTRLTLRVVREGDERYGRYRMSGRLSDQRSPLAGQVVAVVATRGSERIFELVAPTDADGVFVSAIPASELQALRESQGGGPERARLELRARFLPTGGWHAPSVSAPVALDLPPPLGVPLRWYLAGLGLVVSFVALARAIRAGALGRALAWVKRRLEARPGRPALPPPEDEVPPFVTALSAPGAPHRSRTSDVLSGVIVDAHTRAPLEGRVVVRSGEVEEVALAAAGRFSTGPLTHGAWSVIVEAPGHLPRELALEIPHDGAYDGAEWALLAVHRTVREIFSDSLRGLGAPLAWGFATPREASRDALTQSDERSVVEPPLAELTTIVERTHFARSSGTPHDVERARELRQALTRKPPPPGGVPS